MSAAASTDFDLAGSAAETIQRFGEGVLRDPARFRGLLLDVCGGALDSRARRDRARALCLALEARSASDPEGDPRRSALKTDDVAFEVARAGVPLDEATWAANTWASILGGAPATPGGAQRNEHLGATRPADKKTVSGARRDAAAQPADAPQAAKPALALRGPVVAIIALVLLAALIFQPVRSGAAAYFVSSATSALAANRLDDAERSASFALQLDDKQEPAWVVLGDVQLARKRWSNAGASFDRALALESRDPEAWTGKGEAAEARGDAGGALAAYGHAVRIAPLAVAGYAGACRVLVSRAKSASAERRAQAPCKQAVALHTRDPHVPSALCKIDYDLDDWAGSIAACGAAVAATPSDPRNYEQRAVAYFQTNRYATAIADFRKVIALDRGGAFPVAWLGLTLADYQVKRYSDTIVAGHRALALFPRSPKALMAIYRAMGLAYFQLGDRAAAMDAVRHYLDVQKQSNAR